jgi:hypothetical protein
MEFDAWYSKLDKWNRTMVYASQLKNYLKDVGYDKFDDIDRILPGLCMNRVDDTPKLSNLSQANQVVNPALTGQP